MIDKILPLLKHWKIVGVILLIAVFLLNAHLASSRGEKLMRVENQLKEERARFQTQLKQIEKARQDDIERNNFRKSQAKKFRLADDGSLRDAYERLRERQSAFSKQ